MEKVKEVEVEEEEEQRSLFFHSQVPSLPFQFDCPMELTPMRELSKSSTKTG